MKKEIIRKEKVVVYGGGGFLGSHVSDALSDAGYSVRIFDLAPSKYLRPDQEMVVGNMLDMPATLAAAKDCSYVYNFAGLADIDDAQNRPVDTVQLNVLGNIHCLEAARAVGAKRFIFASTVYVYSESGSFYRASKQASERFIEAYQERYGVDYTILRYGSLYGRRADARNGIFRLLKQALFDKRIDYSGAANAMREYIHVTDAAKLSVQILEQEYANRHLVLTGQERMAVNNLMQMIAEMIPDKNIELSFKDNPLPGHYIMTPYGFHPKVGHKIVANDYVDIGQGLLDCLAELYELQNADKHQDGDWMVDDAETNK
jgi:UDP-glucose 4-epimerase